VGGATFDLWEEGDQFRESQMEEDETKQSLSVASILVLGLATLVGTVCAETETAAAPTHEVGERAFVRE
jgi:hypothetical protein